MEGGRSQEWLETTDFYVEPTSTTSWRVSMAIQFGGTCAHVWMPLPPILMFMYTCRSIFPCPYPPPHVLISSSLSHRFPMTLLFHALLMPSSPCPSSPPDNPPEYNNARKAHPSLPQPLHLKVTFVDHTNMTSSLRLEQVCVCNVWCVQCVVCV